MAKRPVSKLNAISDEGRHGTFRWSVGQRLESLATGGVRRVENVSLERDMYLLGNGVTSRWVAARHVERDFAEYAGGER
jgi:hypothetical protein